MVQQILGRHVAEAGPQTKGGVREDLWTSLEEATAGFLDLLGQAKGTTALRYCTAGVMAEHLQIRVGKGDRFNSNEFMAWHMPKHFRVDVGVVGVSTGWGATGEWKAPCPQQDKPAPRKVPTRKTTGVLPVIAVR